MPLHPPVAFVGSNRGSKARRGCHLKAHVHTAVDPQNLARDVGGHGLEAKNTTASATSSAVPSRAAGIASSIFCRCGVGNPCVISVSMKPGETALTRMLREASSRARLFVKPISAALVAA
jgi:hypothetical protein